MNNHSKKSNLSKKLKFISIASAVILCSTISATVKEASANPLSRLFRGVRVGINNPFRGLFRGRNHTPPKPNLNSTQNFKYVSSEPRPNRVNPKNLIFDVDDANTSKTQPNKLSNPDLKWDDMFVIRNNEKRPQLLQSVGASKEKINNTDGNSSVKSHSSVYNWWQHY